jgi:hypothetical protein
MVSNRRFAFALIVIAVSAVGAPTLTSASATPSAARAADSRCVQPGVSEAVSASGVRGLASAGDGLGRVTHYPTSQMSVTVTTPPASWRPLTASDAELKTYGFPPRPKDAAGAKHWQDTFRGYRGTAAPTPMCSTSVSMTVTHTINSINWDGGMTVNGNGLANTFSTAESHWVQPNFVASSCGGQGWYGIWTGLGGHNIINGHQRLIQDGSIVEAGTSNSAHLFWEMLIAGTVDTGAQTFGPLLPPGQQLEAFVAYTAGGGAGFFLYNLTTSTSYGSINVLSLTENFVEYPASSFYDGTTADFMSEAPTVNGTLAKLRQPTAALSVPYAVANGNPIANYPSWRVNEFNGTSQLQNTTYDGIHAWHNGYIGCS